MNVSLHQHKRIIALYLISLFFTATLSYTAGSWATTTSPNIISDFVGPYSKLIYQTGSNVCSKDGGTGTTTCGTNASTVVASSLSAIGTNGSIVIYGPMSFTLDALPARVVMRGIGDVEITTTAGGADIFNFGTDSLMETCYLKSGGVVQFVQANTDQMYMYRFWTNFPSLGGTITGVPALLWDGTISTENASGSLIYAPEFWTSGTSYAMRVTTGGIFQVFNVGNDHLAFSSGATSIHNGSVISFGGTFDSVPTKVMLQITQNEYWPGGTMIYLSPSIIATSATTFTVDFYMLNLTSTPPSLIPVTSPDVNCAWMASL